MWNKLAKIAKDRSYKRLGIALVVSVILHTWMFGGLDLSLPVFKKEMHSIEARLQMPKVAPIKSEPEVVKAETEKPELPPPKQEAALDTPAENTTPEPVAIPEPAPPAEPEKVEPASATEPEQEEQALELNPNVYHYLETDFDVHTKIDGPVEGKGKITYDLNENNQYKLTSLLQAEGLVSLFIPDLLQTSDGLLTESGLQPLSYLYQLGNKTNKARKAVFDWQAKTLQLTTDKGVKTETLLEGTQDLLSFMYQFMHVEPLQNMKLNITNGKKLGTYEYSFEGEELINSSLGEIKTIHIARGGYIDDERTELWLAIEYQYIPVKIRKTEKDGKLYEMVATKIITTRPTIDQSPQNNKNQ